MHVTLTVGWTDDQQPGRYMPMLDGYRPGARQYSLTLAVDWPFERADAKALAEYAFEATNHPYPETLEGVAGEIYRVIQATGFDGSQSGHYSLSVGDTVTVGEVTLACARFGWTLVPTVIA